MLPEGVPELSEAADSELGAALALEEARNEAVLLSRTLLKAGSIFMRLGEKDKLDKVMELALVASQCYSFLQPFTGEMQLPEEIKAAVKHQHRYPKG